MVPFLSTDGYTNDSARKYYPNSVWDKSANTAVLGAYFNFRMSTIDGDGTNDFIGGYFLPYGDPNYVFSNGNTITIKKQQLTTQSIQTRILK